VRLTALDIQNHKFSTRWRGLDPGEVETFLRLIAEDFETLTRECDAARETIRTLTQRVEELSGSERKLQETLISAQNLSDDLKRTAVKEAEIIVSESELKSEKIVESAQRQAGKIAEDIREMRLLRGRLRGALRATIESHLAMLDGLSEDSEDHLDILADVHKSG
jgi:cell division initiation protein